jgi:hypothetical protein
MAIALLATPAEMRVCGPSPAEPLPFHCSSYGSQHHANVPLFGHHILDCKGSNFHSRGSLAPWPLIKRSSGTVGQNHARSVVVIG